MVTEPIRRCAGCGRKTGKSELIRIVRLPSRQVVFDPRLEHQGRSLYFCPRMKCFETLMRRGAPEKLMKSTLPLEVRDAVISYLSCTESAS
jgi:predicted RNA-binding protein YlxR (DUF448 family)